MRFTLQSLFGRGIIQADPHPGNSLFLGGERIAFLDFGCVRRFDRETASHARELFRCLVEGRRSDFDEVVVAAGFAPKPERFDFDYHWRAEREAHAPFLTSKFRFTRGFVRRASQSYGPTSPNARTQGMPAPWLWILRLLWGTYAVLARLEAEGDFRSVLLDALSLTEESPVIAHRPLR
jgi:hypothetical protein